MSNSFSKILSLPRSRNVLVASLIIAYIVLFFALYPVMGNSIATIEIIPVVIIAWFYGMRLGILCSLLIAFLNMVILFPVVGVSTSEILRGGGAVGEAATLLIAIVVGYMHDLRARVEIELTERLRIEQELREIQGELENRVIRRTEELEASERLYRSLLEQASDGILIVDADGTLLVVNERMCEILNSSPDDLLGKNLMDLVFNEDIAYVSDFQEKINSGQTVLMEIWLTRPDQSLVPVESSAKMLENGRYLAIIRDISRRKQTEAALLASEEQFRALFEYSGMAAAIYNEAGELTLVNSLGAKNMGWDSPQEKIGQTITTLFPGEGGDIYLSRIRRVFTTGESDLYEDKIPTQHGNMHFLTNISPVLGETQKTIAVQVVSQNITDLKKAEKALNESQIRLQLVVQHMPIMMNAFDDNGLIIAWNQECERVTGYQASEIINNPAALTLLYPDKTYRQKMMIEWEQRGREYHEWEWVLTCKDGRQRIISWSNVSETLPIPGWASWGIGVDVTERNKFEMQLRQSQKLDAIGRLAGGVAHDFNNILTVINNYSDLLIRNYPDDSAAYRYGSLINQVGSKAANLTQQLLAIARQKPLEPEIVSLNNAIENLLNLLQHMVGMQIEIQTNLIAKMDLVKTDPGQLDQVLINLAVNARDAMIAGGLLTIETSNLAINETLSRVFVNLSPGQYVKLRVQDTGEGMDDFVKERIFEPFFTTKTPGKDSGSGLGLATIHAIVKQSGGDILVDSQPGLGTAFTIYFPTVFSTS